MRVSPAGVQYSASCCRSLKNNMEDTKPKLSVLVVDDEPGWRDLLSLELSSADYWVVTASNTREALARLRERPFDLVITDVRMPGELDGIDLIVTYWRERPAQKAIFITGYAVEGKVESALKQGQALCLAKPFGNDQLLSAMQSLLAA